MTNNKVKKHDVYMPLIIGDWLKGTRGMKANIRGVYLELLLYQWDNGYIPSTIEELTLIDAEVGSVWVFISSKFREISPGRLQNEKLEEVRNYFSKQKRNGQKGGRPTKNNPKRNPTTNPNNIPNHNQHNGIGVGIEDVLKEYEEVEISDNGFWADEMDKKTELTAVQMVNVISYIDLMCKQQIDLGQVKKYWEAFKINNLTTHEWYNSFEKLLQHFRNSLKLELKNGSAKNNSTFGQSNTHRATITGTAKGAGTL